MKECKSAKHWHIFCGIINLRLEPTAPAQHVSLYVSAQTTRFPCCSNHCINEHRPHRQTARHRILFHFAILRIARLQNTHGAAEMVCNGEDTRFEGLVNLCVVPFAGREASNGASKDNILDSRTAGTGRVRVRFVDEFQCGRVDIIKLISFRRSVASSLSDFILTPLSLFLFICLCHTGRDA